MKLGGITEPGFRPIKKDEARFFDAQTFKLGSCSCLHDKASELESRQT